MHEDNDDSANISVDRDYGRASLPIAATDRQLVDSKHERSLIRQPGEPDQPVLYYHNTRLTYTQPRSNDIGKYFTI